MLQKEEYARAEADFDMSIRCDSAFLPPYFNRAVVYSNTNRPMQALADFDRVLQLDSTNSFTYFNRAILRTQIGDYNRALDDFDRVALYSPGNVQVYYLRAMLKTRLGDLEGAERDYTRAIELYPDFANAYLNRSALRYALHNPKAAKRDEEIAQRKIAEYKSHLKDSTYSIYADTTQRMDKLLAFDNQFTNNYFDRISEQPSLGRSNMRLLPLFRFTLMQPDTTRIEASNRYTLQRVKDFEKKLDNPYLVLSNRPTNIGADSLAMLDSRYTEILSQNPRDWLLQVQYAISQSLIRQFTNSVGTYSSAIADNAANPFLYFNRAVTRAEMIDFISGLDNPYQRISIDSDPANKLTNPHTRTYNYDEAIADRTRRSASSRTSPKPTTTGERCWLFQANSPRPSKIFRSHRTESPLRRSVLQPGHDPNLYERHAQGLPRPLESRRAGHYLGLRNPQTLHGGAYRSFLTNNNQFNKL